MCGIAGFVSRRGVEGLPVLHRMNQTLGHRGPDDKGLFVGDNWGMAMTRLSIIDLRTGHQPIWNEDQSVAIVFNGEIYNFREIRRDLVKSGHRFSTESDTEVIVHLYEEKGTDCLHDLNGMFAFALYDCSRRQLFLARDRMGEKPLHYYYQSGEFVFASEIKALLTYPGLETQLNLEALNMYLTFEYVPAPHTLYRNIHKLEPAHYALVKDGALSIKPYWKPSFKRVHEWKREEEPIEQLRWHMKRSVALRMVSDVPLGVFLSGGIDSSLMAAYLCQSSPVPVKTFSISFDEPSFDESRYSREVARFLGTEHHEEQLTSRSMLDLIPDIFRSLDEPLADASIIPTYLLSRFTRNHVKVALSGDGGDELFAGYPTYQAHKVARSIPRWFAGPLSLLADWLPVSDDNVSLDFKIRRFASGLAFQLPERNQIWLGSFDSEQKNSLFADDLRGKLEKQDEFSMVREHMLSCDSTHYLNRLGYVDMRFYLQDDILVKVDRMSMANSLEVRAPFLDHKLVEFACSLEPGLKLKGLTTKYILRRAAEGLIPKEVIARGKKGFGVPIAKWIKTSLKELFLEVLSERSLKEGGIFNAFYVKGLLDAHLANRRDHRKLLWTLFVFEAWRRRLFSAGEDAPQCVSACRAGL